MLRGSGVKWDLRKTQPYDGIYLFFLKKNLNQKKKKKSL